MAVLSFYVVLIFIIIPILSAALKSNKKAMSKQQPSVTRANPPSYESRQSSVPQQSSYRQYQTTGSRHSSYQAQTATSSTAYQSAPGQSHATSSKSEIVERAKKNVKKYEADRALDEMEASHSHKETESSTNVRAESAALKAEHPKNAEHVGELLTQEERTNLKHIKDLMVTGYSGNLSFERDFVAEGQDMINQFLYKDIV